MKLAELLDQNDADLVSEETVDEVIWAWRGVAHWAREEAIDIEDPEAALALFGIDVKMKAAAAALQQKYHQGGLTVGELVAIESKRSKQTYKAVRLITRLKRIYKMREV